MNAQDTKARVLFIGIVQDGKLVQERAVAPGEDVTVGSSETATFVVSDGSFDDGAFPLFVYRDGAYHLRFTSAVRGRITASGAVVALDQALKDAGVPAEGPAKIVTLSESDKGKLRIGPLTVLFRFVEPEVAAMPAPSPAQEKFDFRPRWMPDDDDPFFVGMLGVFLALGLTFGIWVQTVEVPELTMDELPDRFTRIVLAPEPTEQPEVVEEDPVEDDALAIRREAEPAPAEKVEPEPRTEQERQVRQAEQIEEAKQDLREQSALFRELQARMIGTTGENARGTVLRDNAAGDYANIADRLQEAENAGGPLGDGSRIRGSEGVPGGTGDREIEGIAKGADQSGDSVNLGKAPEIQAPKGTVQAGDLDFGGGDATNVEKVVRRYQGQLKYCYERSLKANPSLSGRVVVGWYVDGGAASDVYIVENTTNDAGLAECIVGKVRRWGFDGVDDGEAKSSFVFTPQD